MSAASADLSRTALYRMLSETPPEFRPTYIILKACGLEASVTPPADTSPGPAGRSTLSTG